MIYETPVPGSRRDLKIRLGTATRSPEPVFWTPGDPAWAFGPHIAILGDSGSGKTQLTKSLVTQIHRRQPQLGMLVFDYDGGYGDTESEFVHATGARVLKLRKLPFDPFALTGAGEVQQKHVHRAMAFADAVADAFGLASLQKSTLVQAVMSAYTANGITPDPQTWTRTPPTFQQVYEEYCARPAAQRGDSLASAMETLAAYDIFGQEPEARKPLDGAVVLDMSGYPQELKNLATAVTLERISQDKREGKGLETMILVDKADDLLHRDFPVLQRLLQEGAGMGIGMMLSIRDPECLIREELREWIPAWVIHRSDDLTRGDLEYLLKLAPHDPALDGLYQQLRRLEKHHSLVRLGDSAAAHMTDLPFYQICQDGAESYLVENFHTAPAPEPLAGMPELDKDFISSFDLEEDVKLEPFDFSWK